MKLVIQIGGQIGGQIGRQIGGHVSGKIGGRRREVEFVPASRDRCLSWRLDGQPVEADAIEVSSGIYSILIGGRAYEVHVEAAPAGLTIRTGGWRIAASVVNTRQWQGRSRSAGLEAEGRQQILAPMPGKVVRVLVRQGDSVEAGKGVVVVEAMKMQNEIRSPKTGTVERMLVTEGQPVNAGDVLAVVS